MPFGTPALVGALQVTVTGYDPDAQGNNVAESLNETEPGMVYVTVAVEVTNTGNETVAPTFLMFQAVGQSGREAAKAYGVADSDWVYEDLFAGGSTAGDVAFMVTPEDAATLVLYVEEWLSVDAEPVFFAVAQGG